MPTRFDFISPGIQLNEVDESQIPSVVSDDTGPVIIGRSLSGPAMKPIKVKNLQDFNEIFGLGISGKGNKNNDVWRDGNTLGPTYAVFAAQAHLASQSTPVTFLRLLGEKSDDATTDAQYAGWNIADSSNPSATIANNKSAYGLFIIQSGSAQTGSLGAIFYINGGSVNLSGTLAGDGITATTSSAGAFIKSSGISASRFTVEVRKADGSVETKKEVDFTPGSSKYIRNQFNTNPQLLEANKNFGLTDKNYFLGETFEQAVHEFGGTNTTAGKQLGIILALDSGSLNYGDHKKDMLPAKTGWFLNRKQEENVDGEKLFRLVSLHEGEWLQAGYQVGIKDLNLGNDIEPNSTFTLEIQDKHGNAVEQFSGLNLDPSSENYIAKSIGDQYLAWDAPNTKFNVRGEYTNKSNYVYVEMASAVTAQQLEDSHALPVGCLGPLRPKGFGILSGSGAAQPFGADAFTPGTPSTTAVAAKTVLGIGLAGAASTVPANGEEFQFTILNGDKTIKVSFNTGGDDDAEFATNSNPVNTVEQKINVSTHTTSGEIVARIKSALDHLVLNTINGVILSDYTVTQTGTAISGFQVTIQSNVAVATTYNTTYTDGTDANNFRTGTDTPGVTGVAASGGTGFAHVSVVANGNITYAGGNANVFAHSPSLFTGSFVFPSLRLTTDGANSNGKNFDKKDFQGVRHHRATATTRDDSYIDLTRVLPGNATLNLNHHLGENESLPDSHEYSYIFSLDDVKQSPTNSNEYFFKSGSYDDNSSYSKAQGSIKNLFQNKVRQFRVPFFGGHDGLNLKEVEPFSNKNLKDKTRQTSYAYNSVFKALESVQDPEVIDYNLLAIPGITNTDVTDEVLRVANSRKDHLAIIDIEGGHKPAYETNGSVTTGDINGTITSLEGRKLNTSYAATYYPWVRLRDRIGGQNDVLYVPPSVAAIGALAKSDKASDLWFAPAGFNRGGINELGGSQGPIITGTWEHLAKDDRDDLYQNNINPIARFPSMDQIVIFGQKTLQQSDSALNRINVRRLLIYLKQRIGAIADTILFDQNVNTTWNRFKDQAERVLIDVKNRLGISEFKLVLDEKTTTQDLVDRNIMYAKIYIKPARSIEYIAVDFIISRSGVEF